MAWLYLADVSNSKSCNNTKKKVPKLRVRASIPFPLSKCVHNCKRCKLAVKGIDLVDDALETRAERAKPF